MADANAALPYTEQLAKGSSIKDPELKKSYDMHVQQNMARAKLAKQDAEQAAADKAWTQYVDKGLKVPTAIREAMGETNLQQLIRFEQERAQRWATEGTKPVKTDPTTHRMLWAMVNDDPDKFKSERLLPYGLKLSNEDYEQLTKLQASMRAGKGQKDMISFNNKVNAIIEQNGWIGQGHAENRGAFRRAAQVDYERLTQGDKVLTPAQEDELLNSLAKDIVLSPGRIWDTKGPAFKASPEVRAAAQQFTVGKIYTDANGNRAKFMGGGKWEPIK